MARATAGAASEIAVLMLDREPVDVEGAVAFVSGLFVGGVQHIHPHATRRA